MNYYQYIAFIHLTGVILHLIYIFGYWRLYKCVPMWHWLECNRNNEDDGPFCFMATSVHLLAWPIIDCILILCLIIFSLKRIYDA